MRPRVSALIVLLAAVACDSTRKLDRDIEEATSALGAAKTDAARAEAYTARAHAYDEKAHYSRHHKLIAPEEYARLFDLALEDHARAIALAPTSAPAYLSRGLTYYDRAALDDQAGAPGAKALYASAKVDFTKTLEHDPKNVQALDMRGIAFTGEGDHDGAIADFAAEMELDPRLGRLRLADAYCRRGGASHTAKKTDEAIADYTKSLDLGGVSDACECQPESPLVGLLTEKREYDRAWEVVRKASAGKRWVAPELLEQLKKASGRSN